jgi:hypothetical protein
MIQHSREPKNFTSSAFDAGDFFRYLLFISYINSICYVLVMFFATEMAN